MSIEYMTLCVRKLCFKCQVKKEHRMCFYQRADLFLLTCKTCNLPSWYPYEVR